MARIDPVVGKYIYLDVQGIQYRVFFEENGEGIPLICLHTMGSTAQDWRYILNDEEITSRYRVIAADLPYHGRSLPPESVEWWKQEYRLTKSFLIDFIVGICRALGLEKPVYMGCSIGGFLAPDLALECPDEFRAVIGLESAISGGLYTPSLFYHPEVSNDFRFANVLHAAGPTSPEKYVRQLCWVASQSAPSVCGGDLYYYFMDHDLTDRAREIDTSRVAVYLLTGEYDPTSSPEDTRKLAGLIKGAEFTEMKGLSHFPMAENPEVFKKYLMPILDEIAGRGIIA